MAEVVESSELPKAPEVPEAPEKPESFAAKHAKKFLRGKPSTAEVCELILQGGFGSRSEIVSILLTNLVLRADFTAEDLFRLAVDRRFPEVRDFWGEHGLAAKKFGASSFNDQVNAMSSYLSGVGRLFDKHANARTAHLFGLFKLPGGCTNAHLMASFIRRRIGGWMSHCQPQGELWMEADEWLVLLEAVRMFATEVASEDVKVAPTTAESGSVAE